MWSLMSASRRSFQRYLSLRRAPPPSRAILARRRSAALAARQAGALAKSMARRGCAATTNGDMRQTRLLTIFLESSDSTFQLLRAAAQIRPGGDLLQHRDKAAGRLLARFARRRGGAGSCTPFPRTLLLLHDSPRPCRGLSSRISEVWALCPSAPLVTGFQRAYAPPV